MWSNNSVISLMMKNTLSMNRMELVVVTVETASLSAATAMGAAEDKIDEKDLQLLIIVCGDGKLGKAVDIFQWMTKPEMGK
jgi:hypothetical protein